MIRGMDVLGDATPRTDKDGVKPDDELRNVDLTNPSELAASPVP